MCLLHEYKVDRKRAENISLQAGSNRDPERFVFCLHIFQKIFLLKSIFQQTRNLFHSLKLYFTLNIQ